MSGKSLFDLQAVFEEDDYLYFYSESLTDERTDAEVAALVRLLQLDAPMQILDLACGFGRHTNRLAALGHQVTGIDLMPGFLALARQDAERRGVNVDYRQGDMRQIDFDEAFDRAMIVFTAFGYFEDDENLDVLRRVARALKPGGLFVVDFPNRDVFLRNYCPVLLTEKGDDVMIDRLSLDTLTGRWVNRRIIFRNGIRKDKPFSIRIYNPNEIRTLLAQAGLQVVRMYGNWNGDPVSMDSRRLVTVAAKAAHI
ncbi:MAG: class I SAM-dependent methyltransferase [Chloroflexota bacterium]